MPLLLDPRDAAHTHDGTPQGRAVVRVGDVADPHALVVGRLGLVVRLEELESPASRKDLTSAGATVQFRGPIEVASTGGTRLVDQAQNGAGDEVAPLAGLLVTQSVTLCTDAWGPEPQQAKDEKPGTQHAGRWAALVACGKGGARDGAQPL